MTSAGCTCHHSALIDLNLHDPSCEKRREHKRDCMISHNYYKAGIEAGRREERKRCAEWRNQLLDAWANDHRATMTALLEGGPLGER